MDELDKTFFHTVLKETSKSSNLGGNETVLLKPVKTPSIVTCKTTVNCKYNRMEIDSFFYYPSSNVLY